MPVFGVLLWLTGIVLFVFTGMHAPEHALFRVQWTYQPAWYYLSLATSIGFVLYGVYEMAAAFLGRRKPGAGAAGAPASGTKKCPRCAEYVKSEAKICRYCRHEFSEAEIQPTAEGRWCELCGQPIINGQSVGGRESGAVPVSDRLPQEARFAKIPAVIATLLVCAMFLGAGIYAWQALRSGSGQTPVLHQELESQKATDPIAGSHPAAVSPLKQTPGAPADQEPPGPFRLGSKWAIDWQSKYRYRGVMHIQGQLAPNKYLATLAVTFTPDTTKKKTKTMKKKTRKTVWMEGLVTVTGREVKINCRNPSVSWWDTDNFYLEWKNGTMSGYNVDKKGRRGRAVFTLVEEANHSP